MLAGVLSLVYTNPINKREGINLSLGYLHGRQPSDNNMSVGLADSPRRAESFIKSKPPAMHLLTVHCAMLLTTGRVKYDVSDLASVHHSKTEKSVT